MLIEICEDIVIAAEKNKKSAISVLEKISFAYKYGKHIIYVKYPLLIRIIKIQNLSKGVRKLYSELKSKNTFLGSIYNAVNFKTMITYSVSSHREQNLIIINPDEHNCFEFYEETHLLVENLIDSSFFNFCIEFYKRQRSIKCETLFYPLQGGGDPIDKVYDLEVRIKQHFCIAITDSDKLYPNANIGQTASKIQKVDRRNSPFNCSIYVMNELREIENLIPFHIIKLNTNYKHADIIENNINFNFSYFDFKEGLKIAKMYNQDSFDYWKSNICPSNPQFIQKFNDIEDSRNCFNKTDFENYWIKENMINGFGKNLLECCLEDFSQHLKIITNSDLTPEQLTEWMSIGKILFEWSCSTSCSYV
jgi:hypothetical protein